MPNWGPVLSPTSCPVRGILIFLDLKKIVSAFQLPCKSPFFIYWGFSTDNRVQNYSTGFVTKMWNPKNETNICRIQHKVEIGKVRTPLWHQLGFKKSSKSNLGDRWHILTIQVLELKWFEFILSPKPLLLPSTDKEGFTYVIGEKNQRTAYHTKDYHRGPNLK